MVFTGGIASVAGLYIVWDIPKKFGVSAQEP
jgi:hypothetical protein